MTIEILKKVLEMQASLGPIVEGFNSRNASDFVLKHGIEFEYQTLPKKYKRMTPKQCFQNAATLCLREGLIYVEGFTCIENVGIPIAHAWCVRKGSNRVIDPTAQHARYFIGVPFTRERVAQQYSKVGNSVSLIDDWHNEWPLLRATDAELQQMIQQI